MSASSPARMAAKGLRMSTFSTARFASSIVFSASEAAFL